MEIEKNIQGSPMICDGFKCAIFDEKENKIWIPTIDEGAKEFINEAVKLFKTDRVVFSAVMNPETIRKHFRNIVKEGNEWFEEAECNSYCMEIKWEMD